MGERIDTIQGNFCATCEQTFRGSVAVCPNDGTVFADVRRIENLLFNRYQILSYVGSGGMGTIYKGKQQPLGRVVAIKMLKTLDPVQCARFRQEAQFNSALEHPNIVHIYDFGTTRDNHPFMVMDFVDGGDFSELLNLETFALIECLHIFRQICDGMQHAHNKGIIHRDLKPSNIMLSDMDSSHPTVRIVDFGIAKAMSAPDTTDPQGETKTSEFFGSPYYMSPEQALGGLIDARSDIYSLGCLMYETLTGVLPFAADTPFNTLRMHVNERPIPLRERCPQRYYSEGMENIVMKSLAKEPARRFQTMQDLSNAIAQLQESVVENKRSMQVSTHKAGQSRTSTAAPEHANRLANKKGGDKKLQFALITACAVIILGGISAFCLIQTHEPKVKSSAPDAVDEAIKKLNATAKGTYLSDKAKKRVSENGTSINARVDDGSVLVNGNENDLLIVASPNAMVDHEIIVKGFSAETLLKRKVAHGTTAGGVHIANTRLSDGALECLRGLKSITHLSITHSSYSNDALKALDGMPQLQGLMLNTGTLTDSFVTHLHGLSITGLDLTSQLELTGKTLEDLPPTIEDLNLRLDSGIDGKKFSLLSKYKHLRNLDLSSTQISDQGLAVLQKLKHLQQLELCDTAITDDGVDELLKLPNLKTVELSRSKISGDGLNKLAQSKSLKEIICWESTTLTEDDFIQFRQLKTDIKLIPVKPNMPHKFGVIPGLRELRRERL